MQKILVLGHNGMLGSLFMKTLQIDKNIILFGASYPEIDITNLKQLELFILNLNPELIINCSAYTAVDLAESEVDLAYLVNEKGVGNIVEVAKRIGAYLVHFSTDYVFDGESDKPYKETDLTNPLSVYGKSKLAGEKLVLEYERSLLIRTAWLYGENGKNFVDTMLKLAESKTELKVVNDQVGSPTSTNELVAITLELIKMQQFGVFHVTCNGYCSWYEFALEIFRLTKTSIKVIPCSSLEYKTIAIRPKYSILSKEKVSKILGHYPKQWQESLKEFLVENGKII